MSNKVYRFLKLETHKVDEHEFTCVHLTSQIEGNFGSIQLDTFLDLDGPQMYQQVSTCSGESLASIYQFRIDEMQYVLQISQLFNPIIQKDYGIQETSEES